MCIRDSFGEIPAGSTIHVGVTGEGESAELTFEFTGGRAALDGEELAALEAGLGSTGTD